VHTERKHAAHSAEQKTFLSQFIAMLNRVRRRLRQRRFYPAQRVTAYLS
jgi:hypothetical protein